MVNCSSTKITQSWKNMDYQNYQPKKILVLGVTNNQTNRKIYEQKLTEEFQKKEILANESFHLFNDTFTDLKSC